MVTKNIVVMVTGGDTSPQGLGVGHGRAEERRHQDVQGRFHTAARRGSLCLRSVPRGRWLGPARSATHRGQTQDLV